MKSFREMIEEINGVVNKGARPATVANWDAVDINEEVVDRWTPSASVAFVAHVLEGLVTELKMTEARAIEVIENWLAEAYKWSYSVQPDDKDVSDLAGTEDEPPHADIKRGARVSRDGLTPSAHEWRATIIRTLGKKPPKPILEFPLEVAAETWEDALAMAINKGIGVKWETDKATGIGYPMPDYSAIYGIWKDMLERMVGVRPSRERDIKMKHALDKAAVEAAKDLRKGAEKLGAGRSSQASAILRGRQGTMNPNAA